MKVILCGYNWAGCKALELLVSQGCEVFVFTHEAPYFVNDLIAYCKRLNVQYCTEKIKVDNLPFKPDIIASIYYRYIISKEVMNICDNKIFNLHPSLLPEYKGCSSLTWAMINGEKTTGFTYHYLTPKVDCGNIIFQREVKIEEFDTQVSLYYRVMFESLNHFIDVIQLVNDGFIGFEQDLSKGKYYKRGAPFNGEIGDDWESEIVNRFIRAMIFPPLPLATYKGKEVKNFEEFIDLSK